MPNFGALADVHSTLSNMGKMRKRGQVNAMASKLGVESTAADLDLSPEDLMQTMMTRAKAAGKSQADINAALEE